MKLRYTQPLIPTSRADYRFLFRTDSVRAVLPPENKDLDEQNAEKLPEFLKLLLASFISQSGSHFLTIAFFMITIQQLDALRNNFNSGVTQ